MELTMPHDAIIIGGSYAGLSAAIQLVRARRRVLIIDDGKPRNRFAARAHGVLWSPKRKAPAFPPGPRSFSVDVAS